ncbi:hypothetical protein [Aliivibrio fischeri]|uniref:hypothetical protein n=1 Tax=Aliivibrio fischeri TaxID=668 RepID=UPI0007C4403D|nr:hypothetical protein [Aliivibrio fischeri]
MELTLKSITDFIHSNNEKSKFNRVKQQRMLNDWLLLESTRKLNTQDICKLFIEGEVDDVIRKVWQNIFDDLDEGNQPNSLYNWFPNDIASMLLSSFSKGKKAEVISLCLETYTTSNSIFLSILTKIKQPLFYTVALILMCFHYRGQFEGKLVDLPIDKWQLISIIGYKTTIIVSDYIFIPIASLVAILVYLNHCLPNLVGPKRLHYSMNYPIFKEYRYDKVANVLKTLAILRQAKTRLIDAIEILKSTVNPYLEELLDEVGNKTGTGSSLSSALCIDGLLDPQDKLIVAELLKRAPNEDISLFNRISKRYHQKKEKGITNISYVVKVVLWACSGFLFFTVPIGDMLIGFSQLSHSL